MYSIGLALTLRPGAFEATNRPTTTSGPNWPKGCAQRGEHGHLSATAIGCSFSLPRRAKRTGSAVGRIRFLPSGTEAWREFLETDEQGRLAFTLLPKAFGFGEFDK